MIKNLIKDKDVLEKIVKLLNSEEVNSKQSLRPGEMALPSYSIRKYEDGYGIHKTLHFYHEVKLKNYRVFPVVDWSGSLIIKLIENNDRL